MHKLQCKRLHDHDVSAYIASQNRFPIREDLTLSLAASLILFSIFFVNVALGAASSTPFLGDVGEMLVLFAASAMFVVAILKKEADRRNKDG